MGLWVLSIGNLVVSLLVLGGCLLLFQRLRRESEAQAQLLSALRRQQGRCADALEQSLALQEDLRSRADALERGVGRLASAPPRPVHIVRSATQERVAQEPTLPERAPQEPLGRDRVTQLTDALNRYIVAGTGRNWRRYILKHLPAFQQRLHPVEPGETMGIAESILQVFDDSQEKKFFAYEQEGQLHVFPNSTNISDYALKTRDIFDGYDNAAGFTRVVRPALARKNGAAQWVIVEKGLLQ